jgi:hypothetical protein
MPGSIMIGLRSQPARRTLPTRAHDRLADGSRGRSVPVAGAGTSASTAEITSDGIS